MTTVEIAAFAEAFRADLPDSFFVDLKECTTSLEAGIALGDLRKRGPLKSRNKILIAAMTEMHAFLCTNESSYSKLRLRAVGLSEGAICAIAGFLSGKLEVPFAVAAGAVGFLAIAVTRIGIGTFCRLSELKLSNGSSDESTAVKLAVKPKRKGSRGKL